MKTKLQIALDLIALMNQDNFEEDGEYWIEDLKQLINEAEDPDLKKYLAESLDIWVDAYEDDDDEVF